MRRLRRNDTIVRLGREEEEAEAGGIDNLTRSRLILRRSRRRAATNPDRPFDHALPDRPGEDPSVTKVTDEIPSNSSPKLFPLCTLHARRWSSASPG